MEEAGIPTTEHIARIRESLARMEPVIAQIPGVAQSMTALGNQQAAMTVQLSALQQDIASYKAWQQGVEAWRNDLPNIFIPRRALDREGLSSKVAGAEHDIQALAQRLTDQEAHLQQRLSDIAERMMKMIVEGLEKARNEAATEKKTVDEMKDRKLSLREQLQQNKLMLLTLIIGIVFPTASIILTLILHFVN